MQWAGKSGIAFDTIAGGGSGIASGTMREGKNMRQSDSQVVANLRRELGEKIAHASDEAIAKAWKEFSGSNEYPDMTLFPLWIEEAKP